MSEEFSVTDGMWKCHKCGRIKMTMTAMWTCYDCIAKEDELRKQLDDCELALDDMRLGRAIAERKLDIAVEKLEKIDNWTKAYPLDAFPKPDYKKARILLENGGMTLDAITGDAMRHVITQVGKYATDALAEMSNSNLQKLPESVRYPLDGEPHVFKPFTLGTKPNGHVGIDWDVPVGTPVHAIKDGTVCLMAQDTETYGRFIALLHDDGYSSWYAHLSKTMVHKLDIVEAGQVIGLSGGAVGSDGAGTTTGAHLHFEVRTPGNLDNNKKNIDPIEYIGGER